MKGNLFILVSATLWSTGGVAIKFLDGYSPLTISASRAVICCVFFAVILRGRLVPPKGTGWLTAAGALAYGTVVITFVMATKYTTAANAILLQYTSPLWIALFGWVFLKEKPSRYEFMALAIGGGGIVLCMAEGLTWVARQEGSSQSLLGDGIALLSGVAFAILTLIIRRANTLGESRNAPQHYNALWILVYGNALAFLVGAPVFVAEIGHTGAGNGGPFLGWAVLLWLGVAQLGLGYWFFQRGLATTRALTASLLGLVEPVLNPVLVAVVIGEIPSRGTLLGGAVVLFAIGILLTKSKED